MVAVAIVAVLAIAAVHRCRSVVARRGQQASAAAGVVLFALLTVGPLASWLSGGGLALHVLQHLLVFSLAASALAVGLRGVTDVPRGPAHAAACLVAGVGVFWAALLAPGLRLAVDAPALDALQHAALLGGGALLALPLVGARRLSGFGAAVFLLLCEVAIGAAGIVLAWSPDLLYDGSLLTDNALGLAPETDQALAGAFILVLEEPLLAVEFAAAFITGLAADEARQSREDALVT